MVRNSRDEREKEVNRTPQPKSSTKDGEEEEPLTHKDNKGEEEKEPLTHKENRGEEEQREVKREGEEMGKGWSVIRLAVEQLSVVKAEEKKVSTLAFLGLSNLLLHVLDKIGPTMVVLRQDIQRNIERVEELYVSDPSFYSTLVDILKKEVREGTARKTKSCARAVLWLTRSMDFGIALLQRLEKDIDSSLVQVVEEAYNNTMKPWHGWISSAAYKIALKLIPERKIFIGFLLGQGQDHDSLRGDIKNLVSLVQPRLDEIYALLKKFKLDRLKST